MVCGKTQNITKNKQLVTIYDMTTIIMSLTLYFIVVPVFTEPTMYLQNYIM